MWLKGHNFNLTGMTFDLKFSCTIGFRSEVLNTKGMKAAKLLMPQCTSKPQELLHIEHSRAS